MKIDLLNPELAESLLGFPEWDIWRDIPAARVLGAERVRELQAELPLISGVLTEDRVATGLASGPDVLIRIYTPAKRSELLPGLLWIHGGGYVLGSIQGDDYSVKRLVEAVNCVVVSVEYRLAPEHPYPAPLDDCYAALKWLFAHAEALGVDASRVAVGGISAGGGLAAALALLARDRGEMDLIFQMLLCPMMDDRNVTPSSNSITDSRIWNRDCNLRGWEAYLGGDKTSPYAAAMRAEDLSGLPPAYIPVGSMDLFVDENVEYAQRLNQAGVPTELHVYPGGFHAFEYLVPDAAISRRARENHFKVLKNALGCCPRRSASANS